MLGQVSRTLGPVGVVLAWLAAVVAATFVGVLAVGAVGGDIVPRAQEPLSPEEVRQELASPLPTSSAERPTSTPTGTPSPSSTSSTPGRSVPKALSSPGGVIYARCDPGVQIVSVAPGQGFHLEDDEVDDGGRHLRFESATSKVDVRVTCAGGVPSAEVTTDTSSSDDGDD
jgi:hypothetical protein